MSTAATSTPATSTAATAALSGGTSTAAVIAWVARTLQAELGDEPAHTLVDAGCGQGDLYRALAGWSRNYIGLDAVRYPGLRDQPAFEFRATDLNAARWPVDDACADAAVAVETIEHLENPRALMRELARVAKPGGLVLVTTPNQLSWLSKLALLVKNQHTAFQEAPGLYPTHITALLEADLRHIAAECGLGAVQIRYSRQGRFPGSARRYPAWISRCWPRGASDNVMMLARKAAA